MSVRDGYIYTKTGIALLNHEPKQLSYDQESNTVVLQNKDASTSQLLSKDVNLLSYGKLSAMHDVITGKLNNMLENLDQLSVQLRSKMNEIHNRGVIANSNNIIQGKNTVLLQQATAWQGKIELVVLDKSNQAVQKAPLLPLAIDLTTINSDNSTVGNIIAEINEKLQAKPAIQVGNIGKLNLISDAYKIDNNGLVKFNLELGNNGTQDNNVTIEDITIIDHNNNSIALQHNDLTNISVKAGDTTKSNEGFSFQSSGNFPIKIALKIKTNDNITETVNYVLNDPVTHDNLANKTLYPSGIAHNSSTSEFFASIPALGKAELVDSNGNVIKDPEKKGFIRITADNSQHQIQINQHNSQEVNNNKNFSHFFGINNLFKDYQQVKGSAKNLQIADRILDNKKISVGSLVKDPKKSNAYTISTSNNDTLIEMVEISKENLVYQDTNDFKNKKASFFNYAVDIISLVSNQIAYDKNNLKQNQVFFSALERETLSKHGVDLAEEFVQNDNLQRMAVMVLKLIDAINTMQTSILDIIKVS